MWRVMVVVAVTLNDGGEVIGRFVPSSLAVGASGTIWVVGQARFDDRVIALVCP